MSSVARMLVIKKGWAVLGGNRAVLMPGPHLVRQPASGSGDGEPQAESATPPETSPATPPVAAACPPPDVRSVGTEGPGQGQAALYLERARAEAERLREEARAQGEAEGRAAGQECGYREGWAQAQQEAEDVIHRALGLLGQAQAERRLLLEDSRQELIDLAVEMAARVLAREVALKPETVREQAALVLSRLQKGDRAILHVHPADVSVLEPWLGELQQASGAAEVSLKADPTVERGAVLVEDEHGFTDARFGRQLRRLASALLAILPSGEIEQEAGA